MLILALCLIKWNKEKGTKYGITYTGEERTQKLHHYNDSSTFRIFAHWLCMLDEIFHPLLRYRGNAGWNRHYYDFQRKLCVITVIALLINILYKEIWLKSYLILYAITTEISTKSFDTVIPMGWSRNWISIYPSESRLNSIKHETFMGFRDDCFYYDKDIMNSFIISRSFASVSFHFSSNAKEYLSKPINFLYSFSL